MAIGDAPNDAEMVRWAGVGVAMGGAGAELLAAARYQTGRPGRGRRGAGH